MKFVICDIAKLKSYGIEVIPTMRQSVDQTQVVLHEEYIRNIDEFSKLTRYEFDSSEFTELMNSEEWVHGEDYVQPNEDYAKVKAMQILSNQTRANINTMSLSNSGALEVKEFYPVWSADSIEVKQGERYQYDNLLWECIKDHTTQENWKPGLETASLWKVVDEEHEGTVEDPIPYTPPMQIYINKYYIQNEVIYKCTRDSGTPLSQDLVDLVGLYVEKYNEVSTLSNESLLIEDFIPPMKIEKDHYYKENGIVYKCIQSSKLSISNSLKDLIGYYVEIYKE